MLGSALVGVKARLSGPPPAEEALDGAAIWGALSWERQFTVKNFLLESNLNPVLFCLSLRKIEDNEQLSFLLD